MGYEDNEITEFAIKIYLNILNKNLKFIVYYDICLNMLFFK